MKKDYDNDLNMCYDEHVVACPYKYSSRCPRICNLCDNEQGDITELKKLDDLFTGEHIEGDEK